jgi:hypothetical protein
LTINILIFSTPESSTQSNKAIPNHTQYYKELDKEASAKFKSKQYIDALEAYLKLIGIEEAERKDRGMLAFFWNNAAICWYQLDR